MKKREKKPPTYSKPKASPRAGEAASEGGKVKMFIALDDIPDVIPTSPVRKCQPVSSSMAYEFPKEPTTPVRFDRPLNSPSHRHNSTNDSFPMMPMPKSSGYKEEFQDDDNDDDLDSNMSSPWEEKRKKQQAFLQQEQAHAKNRSFNVEEPSAANKSKKQMPTAPIEEPQRNVGRTGNAPAAATQRQERLSLDSCVPVRQPLVQESNASRTSNGYKPYTLEEYKLIKPKEYVEIKNLQPDLNARDLVAKRANLERIKEFSKNLKDFNKAVASEQRKVVPSGEQNEIAIARRKLSSNRERALEFARKIPKPHSAPKEKGPLLSAAARANGGAIDKFDEEDEDGDDVFAAGQLAAALPQNSVLDALEAKHLDNKRQVEAIKRSMGLR